MNNIIDNLHTNDIQRWRICISKNEIPLKDYVFGKFSKEDNVKW
jgi:peptidyl-tRNA hydrolase